MLLSRSTYSQTASKIKLATSIPAPAKLVETEGLGITIEELCQNHLEKGAIQSPYLKHLDEVVDSLTKLKKIGMRKESLAETMGCIGLNGEGAFSDRVTCADCLGSRVPT